MQGLQDAGLQGAGARLPCKILAEWVTVVQGASLAYGRFLKSVRGGIILPWILIVGISVTRGEYRMHINMEFKSSLIGSF